VGVIRLQKRAPGDRGTEISVASGIQSRGPARFARSLASLVGWGPEQVVRESLRHLKQLMEGRRDSQQLPEQPVGARGMKGAALRVLFYREVSLPKNAYPSKRRLGWRLNPIWRAEL